MSAGERAKYLKSLFAEAVRDFVSIRYLDVGAGLGYNSLAFGRDAHDILVVDLHFPENNVLRDVDNVHMVVADARFLPFRDEVFDMISLFSVIEHVSNQEAVIKDVFRLLKANGYLIIHIPNKFFPIELHSGLPFAFFVPLKVRGRFFKKFGHEGLGKINVPSIGQLKNMILRVGLECEFCIRKVVYPPVIIWSKLRFFYKIALKLGILSVIPLGYMLILKKVARWHLKDSV